MFKTERALKVLAWADTMKEAVGNGELVYLINQNDTDVERELPDQWRDDLARDGIRDIADGMCAGLSMHWIACRRDRRDIPARLVPLGGDEAFAGLPSTVPIASAAIPQAAVNQNIMSGVARRPTTELLARVAVTMMGQYGVHVRREGYVVHNAPVSAALLDHEMRRSGPGLYYVGMRKEDGGGHAIALEYDGQFCRIFDSNTGSYKFHTYERFIAFLGAYLTELIYAKTCGFQTWVAKIELKELPNYKDQVDRLNRRRTTLDRHPQPWQLPDPLHGRFGRSQQPARGYAFQ